LELLFNQDSLNSHLKKEQINDVIEIKIIYSFGFINDYIVVIKTQDEIHFMPVLSNGTKYGGFEHIKIYSMEEFKKLCDPQMCELIILGETIECAQPPIMEYGNTYLPLRVFLEHLGYVVEWEEKTKTIIFFNDDNLYSFIADSNENPYGFISKNGKTAAYSCGFRIVNGRTLVYNMFIPFLWSELNVFIRENNDEHSLTVIHQSCDDDFCKRYRQ